MNYGKANVWIGMFFLGLFVPAFCANVAGSLLQVKTIKVLSYLALICSCVMIADVLVSDQVRITSVTLGIISWIFSLVIPGHILNHEANKELKK